MTWITPEAKYRDREAMKDEAQRCRSEAAMFRDRHREACKAGTHTLAELAALRLTANHLLTNAIRIERELRHIA